jgi:hypothetical protein
VTDERLRALLARWLREAETESGECDPSVEQLVADTRAALAESIGRQSLADGRVA